MRRRSFEKSPMAVTMIPVGPYGSQRYAGESASSILVVLLRAKLSQ